MNVLILSCNTGGGHNAAARAVAEVFRAHGDEAVVLDYLKLAGEKVSRTVGNVYVETVKIAPGLFGLLYKIGMLVIRLLRRSPVDRKSTRLNSSHYQQSRMPSSA